MHAQCCCILKYMNSLGPNLVLHVFYVFTDDKAKVENTFIYGEFRKHQIISI